LRHRPSEPDFNKVLPLLAADKPDLFNAYQQTQGEQLERAMTTAKYLASFIAHGVGKAVAQYWQMVSVADQAATPRYPKVYLFFCVSCGYKAALRPVGEIMAKRNGKRRAWTSEHVRTLKALARKRTPAGKIARSLKRTEGATRQKAFSLGLSLDSRI
jgi:hypothetical protein